jgi:hypothetical protein
MLADVGRRESADMIPLSDGLRALRYPYVNAAIIIANFAVWIFYELPHLSSSVLTSVGRVSPQKCPNRLACAGVMSRPDRTDERLDSRPGPETVVGSEIMLVFKASAAVR